MSDQLEKQAGEINPAMAQAMIDGQHMIDGQQAQIGRLREALLPLLAIADTYSDFIEEGYIIGDLAAIRAEIAAARAALAETAAKQGPTPIMEAFASLREVVGDTFDHIQDVDEYCRQVRAGEFPTVGPTDREMWDYIEASGLHVLKGHPDDEGRVWCVLPPHGSLDRQFASFREAIATTMKEAK